MIKNTKEDLMRDFNEIDMDDLEKVKILAKHFTEWCLWNKSYVTIEVIPSEKFKHEIVVIHNLYEDVRICDNWEFLEDVMSLIGDYCDLREDDVEYCTDFWAGRFRDLL